MTVDGFSVRFAGIRRGIGNGTLPQTTLKAESDASTTQHHDSSPAGKRADHA